jgi:uncharacterized protein YkwD
MVLAALTSGCGGGTDRSASRPADHARSPGPATVVTRQVSDGRLGGAIVARPGTTQLRGRVERITGKLVLPPARANGGVGAEANCTDTEVQPTPQNLAHVADVVLCLMNAMRANAGIPPVTQQRDLATASVDHSQDMVENKYFAHDSLDGRDLVARLKAVGYIPKTGQWVVGENLAWGAGTLATPKALVNAWMNSPPHKANLLASDFREVGMGVAFGTPNKDVADGVTVTTDFGTRPAEAAPSVDLPTPAAANTSARNTRRARAMRRCARKHGGARRRCVRAARRIR